MGELFVKGLNSPLPKNPRDTAKVRVYDIISYTGTRTYSGSISGAPDGRAGGSANHDATIVPLVVHGRIVHLFVCDDTPKTQQAVRRVEVVRIPGFGCIRRASEHFGEELGAEVYDVSFHRKYHRPRLNAAGIDLGGVDVNDGPILGVLLRASTDDD